MKKKLSYRDKLLELAYIYNVREIQEYVKNRKNLTSGQLELILKKNKIAIPKDFKTSFVKDNFLKPLSKFKANINQFKNDQVKNKNKLLRKTENFKHDTQRKIGGSFKNLWKNLGAIGLNFLNIIPVLGKTFYKFFANILVDLFNGLYNQQINPKNVKTVIIGFFVIISITTILITSLTKYGDVQQIQKVEIKKSDVKKPEVKKPEVKKPEVTQKKVVKKQEKKEKKEAKLK